MIFAQPLEITDGILLLIIVSLIAAFIFGFIFGWHAHRAEGAAIDDMTGGLMTPPEKESDWTRTKISRVHDKPRRLRALSGGKP